tara:strand:+ start:341 stop:895 length:555 start_codon:yes stop_codon:yes gene_type:complete
MKNKKQNYKVLYNTKIKDQLIKDFNYSNQFMVPKLEKIVINRGLGEVNTNKKVVDLTVDQLIAITGQKPFLTKSKKAISNFKIRKDQVIGCKVTLRGTKMYDFMSKLFNIVLPKIKDFRGLNTNSFDGFGNYTIGIKEDSIFPEIKSDIEKVRGFDITFVTSKNTTDKESLELLKLFGLPLRKG